MNVNQALEKYDGKIKEIQKVINQLEDIQDMLTDTRQLTLNGMICKRYLQLGTAESVAKEVNNAGFRNENKMYTQRDITKIIESKKLDDVNEKLHNAAKLLLKVNKYKIWGQR